MFTGLKLVKRWKGLVVRQHRGFNFVFENFTNKNILARENS